ncbi:MAG: FAD-binding oxidoreductase [Planctomycetes bacterium]|nr:FAD-binding oxidoreductase [Planctomycetota bacterium]
MRRTSYWESELPPEVPPPADLPARVDVLIVGAGFMGRWLAWFLGKLPHPLRTLVIERDRFSYGASTRNAGFLTCGQASEMLADATEVGMDRVLETFLLRRQGIALVRSEFPGIALDECGSTDYDEITQQTRELLKALNGATGEEVYSVRTAQLGHEVRPSVFNRADAGVHPVRLLRALQDGASAEYAFGIQLLHIGDGTATLSTAGRRHELRYSRAFVCVNAFAGELDASSRVQPGRGQVIVTSPVQTQTDHSLGYLNHGYDYFRFVDGRLLLGGGRHMFRAAEATRELEGTPAVREYLQQLAQRIIGNSNWQVEHHWAGIMGFMNGSHLGGSPRRSVDASTEYVAGFGGMGVALAPVYAQQIANELK